MMEQYNKKWSGDLPREVIEQIAKLVIRAVCRSWRSEASRCLTRPTRSQEFLPIPWIMQSPLSPTLTKFRCSLYSPSDNKIYHSTIGKFARFPPAPAVVEEEEEEEEIQIMMGNKHDVHNQVIQCLGSIDDWLIVVERTWHRVSRTNVIDSAKVRHYLFNPMTGDHVMLPPHSTFPFRNPKKSYFRLMVASSAPLISSISSSSSSAANPNCIVAAIAPGGMLGICRPTDEKWTCLRNHQLGKFDRLVFHEDGKLFAMLKDIRYIVVYDPLEALSEVVSNNQDTAGSTSTTSVDKGKTLRLKLPDNIDDGPYRPIPSLVRSSKGDILLFLRVDAQDVALKLKYSLDHESRRHPAEWVKVDKEDLEDEVIFIGDKGNITSIPMSKLNSNYKFLGVGGGRNCIYFADRGVPKVSVYNIADGTLKVYPRYKRAPRFLKPQSNRVWFIPKPTAKDYSCWQQQQEFRQFHQ